jgi:hypothetical protein
MPQFSADMSGLTRNLGKHFYVFNYDQYWKLITKAMSDRLVHLFPGYLMKLIEPNRLDDTFNVTYRLIQKSLWDLRPLRYSSRDSHAEGERVNRGRDTPNFCPTLRELDMSTLGDAADVNPVIKFLPHTCNIGRSTAATASTILCRSCGKSRGTGARTHVSPMSRDLPWVAGT